MAAVFPSVDKQRPRKSHDFGNRFLANQSSKRCFSHSPFHRLQNSPCFCLFKYAQAVLQYATPILRKKTRLFFSLRYSPLLSLVSLEHQQEPVNLFGHLGRNRHPEYSGEGENKNTKSKDWARQMIRLQ